MYAVLGSGLRPAPVGDGPTTGFFRNVSGTCATCPQRSRGLSHSQLDALLPDPESFNTDERHPRYRITAMRARTIPARTPSQPSSLQPFSNSQRVRSVSSFLLLSCPTHTHTRTRAAPPDPHFIACERTPQAAATTSGPSSLPSASSSPLPPLPPPPLPKRRLRACGVSAPDGGTKP